jgi:threonine aldolase
MPQQIIDLRSDTVTKPSPEMRRAMADAEVGDDVYGEDPTVNRLQERVAQILNKPAALFVPSGVMANQLGIKIHTQPGDEVIVERDAHIFQYETAAPAFISNVQLNTVPGERGVLTAAQIHAAIRPSAYYIPKTSLVCLENTHNRAGGTIYPIKVISEIRALATEHKLAMHLDGARLWNASVATGITPAEYAGYFDTVAVCFSKGLGAPVGSALAGSREAIEKARTFRKILGGGMRQAGILAAAALYALEHNISRLAEDHRKAQAFAEQAAKHPNVGIELKTVQTNMVMIDVSNTGKSALEIIARLRDEGVLVGPEGSAKIRIVTHLDVSMDQVQEAARILLKVLG